MISNQCFSSYERLIDSINRTYDQDLLNKSLIQYGSLNKSLIQYDSLNKYKINEQRINQNHTDNKPIWNLHNDSRQSFPFSSLLCCLISVVSLLTYLLTKKELTPGEVDGMLFDMISAGVDSVSIHDMIRE